MAKQMYIIRGDGSEAARGYVKPAYAKIIASGPKEAVAIAVQRALDYDELPQYVQARLASWDPNAGPFYLDGWGTFEVADM